MPKKVGQTEKLQHLNYNQFFFIFGGHWHSIVGNRVPERATKSPYPN